MYTMGIAQAARRHAAGSTNDSGVNRWAREAADGWDEGCLKKVLGSRHPDAASRILPSAAQVRPCLSPAALPPAGAGEVMEVKRVPMLVRRIIRYVKQLQQGRLQ